MSTDHLVETVFVLLCIHNNTSQAPKSKTKRNYLSKTDFLLNISFWNEYLYHLWYNQMLFVLFYVYIQKKKPLA